MSSIKTQAIDSNEFKNVIDSAMNSIEITNDNPFPTDVFPLIFKDLITNLKNTLNFQEDYTGTAILSAISTIIGTSAKVKVKNNWLEFAPIYCCLIGNSGASKTHPVNLIFSPIKKIDGNNHDQHVKLFLEFAEYQKLSKKAKEINLKVCEPILTKSLLTNFTPEVLNKRLSENLRGCTVLSDEMATFFEGMNNYSKGDQIGVYLSFWSNQPTTIDRIGNPIPLFIQTPFLSIIGTLQPRMLVKSFSIQKLNNGFYQRFLYAFPDSSHKEPINDNEFDDSIYKKYESFIDDYFSNTIVSKIDGNLNTKILKWTDESKNFFYQWQKENCDRVNENQDNIKGEIMSKFDIHFIRLSLLLQVMENPQSNEVEIKATQGAKKLCDYYLRCSLKALAVIQDPIEYSSSLAENKKKFYNMLKETFTTAEAIEIGNQTDFQERRIKEFLNDDILFNKIKHGVYQKTIQSKQK